LKKETTSFKLLAMLTHEFSTKMADLELHTTAFKLFLIAGSHCFRCLYGVSSAGLSQN